jgi:dTDP-4-amino-4,6-dideoxygalactose transaminase
VSEIPLVDLGLQHAEIADEVTTGWARVVDRGAFVLGAEVEQFEEAFATFQGVRHCVGVGNGTDALELAIRSTGTRVGDEIILPTNSFVATAEAIQRAGATPVLVDIDPTTYLLDVDQVMRRIGPRTKAVIAVHLYGQIAPIEILIRELDGRVGLLEDAAQAHGATRHGIAAGRLGVAAATSFYPGKNLGAYGDGGAVLTQDDQVAEAIRSLRNHGSRAKYEHLRLGFNSRLDTLQAVVLLAKLDRLAVWNEQRRRAAARYDELLEPVSDVVRPAVLPGNEHVWHLYVVRVPRRDEVLARLNAMGIGASIHYPVPIHLQAAFADLARPGAFPAAERASSEILSLPMYPGITAAQQERVAAELERAILRRPAGRPGQLGSESGAMPQSSTGIGSCP